MLYCSPLWQYLVYLPNLFLLNNLIFIFILEFMLHSFYMRLPRVQYNFNKTYSHNVCRLINFPSCVQLSSHSNKTSAYNFCRSVKYLLFLWQTSSHTKSRIPIKDLLTISTGKIISLIAKSSKSHVNNFMNPYSYPHLFQHSI